MADGGEAEEGGGRPRPRRAGRGARELDAEYREESRQAKSEKEERKREKQQKLGRGDATIHMCCTGGHPDVLRVLLDGGADIHCQSNRDGSTAMMRAITAPETNSVDPDKAYACVSMLIDAGADLNIQNFAGHTALHVAFAQGMMGIADLLIDNGGKPCNNGGRSCQKCTLNFKIRAKQKAKSAVSQVKIEREETSKVLEEEFGDGDFASFARAFATGRDAQLGNGGAASKRKRNRKKKKKKVTPVDDVLGVGNIVLGPADAGTAVTGGEAPRCSASPASCTSARALETRSPTDRTPTDEDLLSTTKTA